MAFSQTFTYVPVNYQRPPWTVVSVIQFSQLPIVAVPRNLKIKPWAILGPESTVEIEAIQNPEGGPYIDYPHLDPLDEAVDVSPDTDVFIPCGDVLIPSVDTVEIDPLTGEPSYPESSGLVDPLTVIRVKCGDGPWVIAYSGGYSQNGWTVSGPVNAINGYTYRLVPPVPFPEETTVYFEVSLEDQMGKSLLDSSYSFSTSEAGDGVMIPIGALYIDGLRYENPDLCATVVNQIPANGETDVDKDTAIWLHVVSLGASALDSQTKVWVTSSVDGVKHLAYSQPDGGFQAGYSGSATLRMSPGSAVNDELVLIIQPAAPFTSKAIVFVEVHAEAGGGGCIINESYWFEIEDLTAPSLESIFWLTPKKARVKFNEAASQDTTPGGARFCLRSLGGVEIVAEHQVRIAGATLTTDMVGYWMGLAGSAYPENSGFRKISGVNVSTCVVTLAGSAMTPDDGLDANDAGVEVRRRDLLAVISPYRFVARITEEGADAGPHSPERVQCAYEIVPVQVDSVPAEELPTGADPDEYVYIYVHQHVSRGRLYRIEATGIGDVWGNECVDSQLDFCTPAFGYPENRLGFWSPGVAFNVPDQEEDLDDEAQLRKMAIVLQDVLNVLWYEVDTLQFLKSSDLCKEEWLDWLLHNQGNPFRFPLETEMDKRKLASALRPFYALVGTAKGIIEMVYAVLGIKVTIHPYIDSEAWILGDEVYGVLGVTTILAASTMFAKNCYEIHSPVALTTAQVRIIREIATWADPPNMHLIKIIEEIWGGATYTILDVSAMDTNVEPQPED